VEERYRRERGFSQNFKKEIPYGFSPIRLKP
jgi:hypothetical protein